MARKKAAPPPSDAEILRRNVATRTAYMGCSLKDCATKHKLNPKRVYGWVRPVNTNPRLDLMSLLGKILGVPTWELLNPGFNPSDYPA